MTPRYRLNWFQSSRSLVDCEGSRIMPLQEALSLYRKGRADPIRFDYVHFFREVSKPFYMMQAEGMLGEEIEYATWEMLSEEEICDLEARIAQGAAA
jgi:hypothetical protein